jgi:predicted metal-dependent HD superfamily phosphohydrolase
MNYTELNQSVEAFIRGYYASVHDERLIYHNQEHTERVVAAARQIADHYQLNERDYCIVITAAWFHDIGYFIDPAEHEAKGKEKAESFLKEKGADEAMITAVSNAIMATKMPQNPQSLLEQIVCDADLFNLGTDYFEDTNKVLRKENEALKGKKITKEEWRLSAIHLLENHQYHTDYCKVLLNDKKARNLDKLKRKSEAMEPLQPVTSATIQQDVAVAVPEAKAAKKDKDRPDRGIETMFRTTSGNNQRLSDMADNKAHIMITVNSIILSAVISLLLGKIPKQEYLAVPTYLILAVSVTAIIFAILATRPSLPSGIFTRQDVEEKKVNLLFFGNFYKMNLDEYSDGMWKVMADRDFLYGSLIKDVYSQGVVLGRKYRLLRISYSVFMYGLIMAVIAFIIASIAHAQA